MHRPKLIIPRRAHFSTRFADLYELNPGFNARNYKEGGHPFVILKASEGAHHIDSQHLTRTNQAHGVNLPVGHYHFCRPDAGVGLEAVNLRDAVQGSLRTNEPIIFDIEVPTKHAALYIRELERRTKKWFGGEIIGYASLSYLRENPGMDVSSKKWWIADYTKVFRLRPPRKLGSRVCWAWQYTDAEHINGVYAACDASVLMNPASIEYWRAHELAAK